MDETVPNWDNRDPETGRHLRNGHILEIMDENWKCAKCGHYFDAAADADLFVCGEPCAGKHPGDNPSVHEEVKPPARVWSYQVPDDPKMLRETLCTLQGLLSRHFREGFITVNQYRTHNNKIQNLIDACDWHRPLGSDGKHGKLHTSTCGCDIEDIKKDGTAFLPARMRPIPRELLDGEWNYNEVAWTREVPPHASEQVEEN